MRVVGALSKTKRIRSLTTLSRSSTHGGGRVYRSPSSDPITGWEKWGSRVFLSGAQHTEARPGCRGTFTGGRGGAVGSGPRSEKEKGGKGGAFFERQWALPVKESPAKGSDSAPKEEAKAVKMMAKKNAT